MLKLIADKWIPSLPGVANLNEGDIVHEHRAEKEVAFLWLILHKALVVNKWRGQILVEVDNNCPHCGSMSVVYVEQNFYELHVDATGLKICC